MDSQNIPSSISRSRYRETCGLKDRCGYAIFILGCSPSWLQQRSQLLYFSRLSELKDGTQLRLRRALALLVGRFHEEEAARLKEVTKELERNSPTGMWLQQHARFCLRHMHEVKQRVPASLRKVVEELGTRNIVELEAELEEFLQQARHGNHAGGGVLGRAAEFLVAQRGILD
jgi:hypothetical protein